jgi:hypothetical protein
MPRHEYRWRAEIGADVTALLVILGGEEIH